MKPLFISVMPLLALSCVPICADLQTAVGGATPTAKVDSPEGRVFRFRFTQDGSPYVVGPVTPLGGSQRKYHDVSDKTFRAWTDLAMTASYLMRDDQFAARVESAKEEVIEQFVRLTGRNADKCRIEGARLSSQDIGQIILERVFAERGIYQEIHAALGADSSSRH